MTQIRPNSDLCNKDNEISEQLCGKAALYRLLDEGLKDVEDGLGRPAADVFADIEFCIIDENGLI